MDSSVKFTPLTAHDARIVSEHAANSGSPVIAKRVSGLLAAATRAIHKAMINGMFNVVFALPNQETSWGQIHTDEFVQVLCREWGFGVSCVDPECILILW
jgi:hypothetical protein